MRNSSNKRCTAIYSFSAFIPTIPESIASPLLFFSNSLLLENLIIAMNLFENKITSDRLFRLLFHLLFWGLLLGLPFITMIGNEGYHRHLEYMKKVFPANLSIIPLFFLNTEWLIPRVLRKKGVGPYLITLLVLMVSFFLIQNMMREWMFNDIIRINLGGRGLTWTVLYTLLISAAGTAYGLISSLLNQDKARQEEQRERLQSELSFLRSQISPHFIFNILNSIVYLIRSKSQQAEAVTIKLSELMRYILYQSNNEQILLEKEINYLKNYVELQTIRFDEDVDIRLHIEGEASNQTIEPMLMIPFVENAFKHGVGMVMEPVIDINVQIKENSLDFSVKNKIGPEPPEDKDTSSGIGLRNVQRRLELLYPDNHELSVEKTGEWFNMYFHLKFIH